MTSLFAGTGDDGVRGGRGERFSRMFVYLRNSLELSGSGSHNITSL